MKKKATDLTQKYVSILTERTADEGGVNHRCAYSNSASGRGLLMANEPEDIVSEVFSVWGEEPTAEEFDYANYVAKPTTEERITALEETAAIHEENEAELLYQVSLMQLGIADDDM